MNNIKVLHQNRVDPEKQTTAIRNRWNVGPDDEKYEYLKNFTQTVANSDLYNLEGYEVFKDDPSLNVDLFKLAVEVGNFLIFFKIKASTILVATKALLTPNVVDSIPALHYR